MPATQATKEKMSMPAFSLAASTGWPRVEQNDKTNPPLPPALPQPPASILHKRTHRQRFSDRASVAICNTAAPSDHIGNGWWLALGLERFTYSFAFRWKTNDLTNF